MLRTSEESKNCKCPFPEMHSINSINSGYCLGDECMAWTAEHWKCEKCGERFVVVIGDDGCHGRVMKQTDCDGTLIRTGKCGRI